MVLTTQLDNELRKVVKKKSLSGLVLVTSHLVLWLIPMADMNELNGTLQELCVQNDVIHMASELVGSQTSAPLKELVHECWNLEKLSQDYQEFLQRFRPILRGS